MDKQDKGKLIVSAGKSLRGYQNTDARIATLLYGTLEASRLGLFASAIKSEERSDIHRITALAGQEGITPPNLINELLPWLERAGLCQLGRDGSGAITEVTSLILAYADLLAGVSDFYDSRHPTDADRSCLDILAQVTQLPTPETVIRHSVASAVGEQAAGLALSLAKSYKIVATSGSANDPLVYAPRIWSGLHSNAPRALSPLDATEREILLHLVDRVRRYQGYPESLVRTEAATNGVIHLVDLAIGIGLVDRTELYMADRTTRSFLTTPHFYTDLADEFGEDMCDRVKIFLDSIRNGQYFGYQATGRIFDPRRLLRALLNRGSVGRATAIGTDYIAAEKAGIIRVQRESPTDLPYMELRQPDTVQKVYEIVSSGSVEPGAREMNVDHLTSGTDFMSIEQVRGEFGGVSGELAEIEHEIIRNLREA